MSFLIDWIVNAFSTYAVAHQDVPGQPLKHEILEKLTQKAQEELTPEATALDYVCAELESGSTLLKIAQEYRVTRKWLSRIVNALPSAKERLAEARKAAAPHYAEEAIDILDAAPPDDKIALDKAKEQSRVRLWMAERLGRETYGQQPQATANVNILSVGQAHLDAFRAIGVSARPYESPSQTAPQSLHVDTRATISPTPVVQPQLPEGEPK